MFDNSLAQQSRASERARRLGVALLALIGSVGCLETQQQPPDNSPLVSSRDVRAEKWRATRARAAETARRLLDRSTVTGEIERAEQTAGELALHGLTAAAVIVGHPVEQHVAIETLSGEPFPRTYVTIQVEQLLLGAAPAEIVVSFWGGEYQAKHIASSSTVTLDMGVTKLFFLSNEGNRGHGLLARGSGYGIDADAVNTGGLRLPLTDYVSIVEPMRRAQR